MTATLEMTKAKTEEARLVLDLVNAAYGLEIGDQGLAFKTSDRRDRGNV